MEEPMKSIRYGIAVGLLAGLGACSNMMGGGSTRDTAMAPAPVASDMVRQVQSKLRDGGYYKQGAVDGVWGPGTEASVRSFQHDHNLTSSGQLDMPTLQALNLAGGPATNTTANNAAPTQPNYNPPPRTTDTTAPAQPRTTDTNPPDQQH
jgi:peptidoglycan hydrolase-like protein with peptidoglycan-binding domain